MEDTAGTLKFAWIIKNFSNLQAWTIYSDVFSLGSYKWRILAHPKGNNLDKYLSIYLDAADSATLPSGWSRKAKFSLTVIDQVDNESSLTKDFKHEFDARASDWGSKSFISHEELYDPKKGYLVEDTCIIEASVTLIGGASVGSHGAIEKNKKEQPNENFTKEDMDAFFVDLNSVIFPKKVVSSEDEEKEAFGIIEESLNFVPADLNNPGRLSQLENAFDVLSSLDNASVLASEQKEKLVSMKDCFIDLAERAAQAVKDKKLFAEKELVKKTLDHKLGRCLIKYEKAKAETMQNEEDIAILQKKIDEKKQKREDSTSMQKEMFEQSKGLKVELDVLVKLWPVYEAKMNAAEEEEKVVAMEWSKLKQLFPSLKKPVS